MPTESGKIFFSYSRSDAEFVLRLAKELRSGGANLWLDQLDIPAGQRWDRAVEDALHTCELLLVILSPISVDSHNVMDEVSFAIEEHKRIIPILYRECKLPFRLRRLQYVDFTGAYDSGMSQLLKAVNLEPLSKASERRKDAEPSVKGLGGLLGITGQAINWRLWLVFLAALMLSKIAFLMLYSISYVQVPLSSYLVPFLESVVLAAVALVMFRRIRNEIGAFAVTATCHSLVAGLYVYLHFLLSQGFKLSLPEEVIWEAGTSIMLLAGISVTLYFVEWVWVALCMGMLLSGTIGMAINYYNSHSNPLTIMPTLMAALVFATVGWAGHRMVLRKQAHSKRRGHN